MTGDAGAGPGGPDGRRDRVRVLALGAAGAGAALLAAGRPWASAVFTPPAPLPTRTVPLTGADIVPAGTALALAALAGLVGLLATRGRARATVGLAVAALGIALVGAVAATSGDAALRTAAAARDGTGAGVPEIGRRAVLWPGATAAGGALIAIAGALAMSRGGRWPGMSARYRRPAPYDRRHRAGPPHAPHARPDGAALWDVLDQGIDPTDEPSAGRPPG